MEDPFAGIEEKLKRANQSVLNLDTEISTFFQKSDYPVLPKDNYKVFLEAVAYHQKRAIPLRFSVLVGEIIHNLRSCFDHIVWHFSAEDYRRGHFHKIEFPVFGKLPIEKDSISRYEGKIKGITDPKVREMIEQLQPYNATDPINSPILIIHKMDITDKHRELVLCDSTGAFELPTVFLDKLATYKPEDFDSIPVDLAAQIDSDVKVVPQIAFNDFGRRKSQTVIPGLIQLLNYTVKIVANFDAIKWR